MAAVPTLTIMLIVTTTAMVIEAGGAADGTASRAASRIVEGAVDGERAQLRMQMSAPQIAQPSNGALGEEPMCSHQRPGGAAGSAGGTADGEADGTVAGAMDCTVDRAADGAAVGNVCRRSKQRS